MKAPARSLLRVLPVSLGLRLLLEGRGLLFDPDITDPNAPSMELFLGELWSLFCPFASLSCNPAGGMVGERKHTSKDSAMKE